MKIRDAKKIIIVLIFSITQLANIAFPQALLDFSADLQNVPSSIQTVQALSEWLSHNFTYRWEFPDKWQTPQETIDTKTGDCEDFAVLASSILTKMGIENEIILIKFRGLQIGHAICAWKNAEGSYNFISGPELCQTTARDIKGAVERYYPDWQKITFVDIEKNHLKTLARKC